MKLPVYKSLDSVVTSRGRVFVISNPVACKRQELSERYIGKELQIDGELVVVKGVESFCIEDQREGITLGLLV